MTSKHSIEEENAILDLLAQAWNRYAKLPVQHPMEMQEFAMKIHDAQRMVMARMVRPLINPEGVAGDFNNAFRSDPDGRQ